MHYGEVLLSPIFQWRPDVAKHTMALQEDCDLWPRSLRATSTKGTASAKHSKLKSQHPDLLHGANVKHACRSPSGQKARDWTCHTNLTRGSGR